MRNMFFDIENSLGSFGSVIIGASKFLQYFCVNKLMTMFMISRHHICIFYDNSLAFIRHFEAWKRFSFIPRPCLFFTKVYDFRDKVQHFSILVSFVLVARRKGRAKVPEVAWIRNKKYRKWTRIFSDYGGALNYIWPRFEWNLSQFKVILKFGFSFAKKCC